MKVLPRQTIVFEGTIYNAGDELPVNYVSEEGCVAKGPHTKLVGEDGPEDFELKPKKKKNLSKLKEDGDG